MSTTTKDQVSDRTAARRAALASLVGSTVEWYDYFIFGTASALVFGELFFPNASPLAGTLAAFASFGVGFLARPLGGIVFGVLGDRIGRKSMLVATLLIMGISTTLIGLLPTAAHVGILAPVLLVLLRLAQGFGVGGEWGGAALIAVEHAPDHKRGRYGSVAQMGVGLGVVLSSAAFAAIQFLTTDEQFKAWGWRIPFVVGFVLVFVGFWIRRGLTESPEFQRLKESGEAANSPLAETLTHNRAGVWSALGMRISENVFGYVVLTFSIAYVVENNLATAENITGGIALAGLFGCLTYYLAAWASDRVGRRPVYLAGGTFAVLYAYPFFWLLDTESVPLTILALGLGWGVASGVQFGVQPAYFPELFGANVRYTGMSIGYQVGSVLGGGFAPFIATALLAVGGGSPRWVIAYLIGCGLLSLFTAYLARDPYRDSLRMNAPNTTDGVRTPQLN
ncbi:MFS transporter [Nocardioides insulae]|uniref:MFS transporter n=1 Tax=Nocardioides insulae TaxID=394734 RepID=UPI0004170D9B|nr:MFS transporter [Nocardioides insulae]